MLQAPPYDKCDYCNKFGDCKNTMYYGKKNMCYRCRMKLRKVQKKKFTCRIKSIVKYACDICHKEPKTTIKYRNYLTYYKDNQVCKKCRMKKPGLYKKQLSYKMKSF